MIIEFSPDDFLKILIKYFLYGLPEYLKYMIISITVKIYFYNSQLVYISKILIIDLIF